MLSTITKAGMALPIAAQLSLACWSPAHRSSSHIGCSEASEAGVALCRTLTMN